MTQSIVSDLDQFDQKLSLSHDKENCNVSNIQYSSPLSNKLSSINACKQQQHNTLYNDWIQQATTINTQIDEQVRSTLETNKLQSTNLLESNKQLLTTLTPQLISTYTQHQLNDVFTAIDNKHKQCVEAYNSLLQQLQLRETHRQQQLNASLQSTIQSLTVLQYNTTEQLHDLYAELVRQINITLNTNNAEYKLLVDTLIQQCTTQYTEQQSTINTLRTEWSTQRYQYLLQLCNTELTNDLYVKHNQKATLIGKINKQQTELQQHIQHVFNALLTNTSIINTLTNSIVHSVHSDINNAINSYDDLVNQVIVDLHANNKQVQQVALTHIDTCNTLLLQTECKDITAINNDLSNARDIETARHSKYTASIDTLQSAHQSNISAYRTDIDHVIQYLSKLAALLQTFHTAANNTLISTKQQQHQLTVTFEQQLSAIQIDLHTATQQLQQASTVELLQQSFEQCTQLLTDEQTSIIAVYNKYLADTTALTAQQVATAKATLDNSVGDIAIQFGLETQARRDRLAAEHAAAEAARLAQQDAEDALLSKADLAKVKKHREKAAIAAAGTTDKPAGSKKRNPVVVPVVKQEETLTFGDNALTCYVMASLNDAVYNILHRSLPVVTPPVDTAPVKPVKSPITSKPGTPNTTTATLKSKINKKKVEIPVEAIVEVPVVIEYSMNSIVLDIDILINTFKSMQSQLLAQLSNNSTQSLGDMSERCKQYTDQVSAIQQSGVDAANKQLLDIEQNTYNKKLKQLQDSSEKLQRHLQRQSQLLNTAQSRTLALMDSISNSLTAYNTVQQRELDTLKSSQHTSMASIDHASNQYKRLHKDAIAQLNNLLSQCTAVIDKYKANADLSDTQYLTTCNQLPSELYTVQQQLQTAAGERMCTVTSLQQSIQQLQQQSNNINTSLYDAAYKQMYESVQVYNALGLKYGQPILHLHTQYQMIIGDSTALEQQITDSIDFLSQYITTGTLPNDDDNTSLLTSINDLTSMTFKQCYKHAQLLQCLVTGVVVPAAFNDTPVLTDNKVKSTLKSQTVAVFVDTMTKRVEVQIQQCRDSVIQNISEYENRMKPVVTEVDTSKSKTAKAAALNKTKRLSKKIVPDVVGITLPTTVQTQLEEVQRNTAQQCTKLQYNLLIQLDKLYGILLQLPDKLFNSIIQQHQSTQQQQVQTLITEYNNAYKQMLMVYSDVSKHGHTTAAIANEVSVKEDNRHQNAQTCIYNQHNTLSELYYQGTQTILPQLIQCAETLLKLYDTVMLPTDIEVPADTNTTQLMHYNQLNELFKTLIASRSKPTGTETVKSSAKKSMDTAICTYASVRYITAQYAGVRLDSFVATGKAVPAVTTQPISIAKDVVSNKSTKSNKSNKPQSAKSDTKSINSTDKKSKKGVVEPVTCSSTITALSLPIHTAVCTTRDFVNSTMVTQYNKTILSLSNALENQITDEQNRHQELLTQISTLQPI